MSKLTKLTKLTQCIVENNEKKCLHSNMILI